MGTVPAFGLYGERTGGLFPDPLHVETIATRSAIHAWRIRSHRHVDLSQLFLITAGGGTAMIDGTVHPIPLPALIVMPPLVAHGFAFAPGTVGHVASIPAAAMARALGEGGMAATMLRTPRILRIETAEAERLGDALTRALDEFAGSAIGRAEALTAHAGLLAVAFARAAGADPAPRIRGTDAGSLLVRRFLDQIEGDFRRPRAIADRAAELGVSAPHLTRVCRSLLGRSALALVHDRIILEARRSLVYTSMTVAQVAYGLGFSDPAYFSRFFTARVGRSPSDYRSGAFSSGDHRAPDG